MGPELAPFAKLQTFPGTPGDILVPEARQMETNFLFSRDSEAAFGSESATRGGSTRTRPGCACSVWHRKCDQERLVLDQN